MLFRFREAQAAELGIGIRKHERRPTNTAAVTTVHEADKWRGHVIREIARKVAKIQDSTLNEFAVRDLNDTINRLLREKRSWEYRIKELGGPDYRKSAPRLIGDDGKEVPGSRGYRYFGRARELPGVKELFEAAEARTDVHDDAPQRAILARRVDADYFGYRDEDDGKLLAYERALEAKACAAYGLDPLPDMDHHAAEESSIRRRKRPALPSEHQFLTRVSVPARKDVEKWLLKRRKIELAEQFGL